MKCIKALLTRQVQINKTMLYGLTIADNNKEVE